MHINLCDKWSHALHNTHVCTFSQNKCRYKRKYRHIRDFIHFTVAGFIRTYIRINNYVYASVYVIVLLFDYATHLTSYFINYIRMLTVL